MAPVVPARRRKTPLRVTYRVEPASFLDATSRAARVWLDGLKGTVNRTGVRLTDSKTCQSPRFNGRPSAAVAKSILARKPASGYAR